MYLKLVQMENFKSFDRKVSVPMEPGFTGITGPNGSGKSNIGDAILFVLGPNSPKAIRAGRLTDLIFNGGQAGKAATSCIVSLVFDNQDRTMPIDADEVILTRRVKKTPKPGDPDAYSSAFYVNGRASQKREFVDLLQHGRIAADGYNITKQGDVQAIVTMGGVERRKILDQMAGITQFDTDIKKAEEEKTKVSENMDTISIIMEEIGKNLSRLEKEKASAQRLRDLKADLVRTRGLMAHRVLVDLESELAGVLSLASNASSKRDAFEQERNKQQDLLSQYELQYKKLEEEIAKQGGSEVQEVQRKLQAAREGAVRIEENANYQRDDREAKRENLLPLGEILRKATGLLEEVQAEQAQQSEELTALTSEINSLEAEFNSLNAKVVQASEGGQAIQKKLGDLRRDYDEAVTAKITAEAELKLSKEAIERYEGNLAGFTDELGSAKTNELEARTNIELLTNELSGVGASKQDYFSVVKAHGDLRANFQDMEKTVIRLRREVSQLESASEAVARATGWSRAVEDVLGQRRNIAGIMGTIAELASVDPKVEVALQIAAGSNLQAIVVEDDSAAAKCIDYLKTSRSGRAKFLPLTKMTPGRPRGQALMKIKEPGVLGFAIELIKFPEQYRNAFWHVLGDTLVVDNLRNARSIMGGVRIVTLDGELIEAGGAMVGGSLSKGQLGPGFSQAKENSGELDEKRAELAKCERLLDKLESEWQHAATQLAEAEAAKNNPELTKKQDEVSSLRRQLPELQAAVTKALAALEDAKGKLAAANEEAHSSESKLAAADVLLAELDEKRKTLQELSLKGTKKEWRDRIQELDGLLRQKRDEQGELKGLLKGQNDRINLYKTARDDAQKKVSSTEKDIDGLTVEIKEKEKLLQNARTEVEGLRKLEEQLTSKLGELATKRNKCYEQIVETRAKREKAHEQSEAQHGIYIQAKAKIPPLEETVAKARQEALEVTLEPGTEIPRMDELKRDERDANKAIESLGAVNMRAIEDYETEFERGETNRIALARLGEEKEQLEALVTEISLKRKTVFMKVFDGVNAGLRETFRELSKGGDAYLELEDPEDPFNGGLILRAQPFGKRVTRMESLSGGEKSLCSMAFIFALQRYDPSCFYYLDEVDMNLDSVNAELLAEMVARNSVAAQFIVVSLRKVTLKEAQRVYGVTQFKPGVSEVIANFDVNKMADTPVPGQEDDGLDGAIKSMLAAEVGA